MKKCSFVLVNILICAFAVTCIDVKPCLSQPNRRQVIERYLVSSYATAFGGLNFPSGHGKLDDIWVEADINQHWHFQPGFFNDRCFLKINPRVRLRLFQENSTPVKTPSFMPNITLFFGFGKTTELTTGFTYYSIMLSHHSNGQAGEFYNPNTDSINIQTGSFSTNFFDFGINRIWGENQMLQAWTRLSLIWHPGFNRSDELKDQYEKLKIALTTSTIRGKRRTMGFNMELNGYISYTLKGLDYTLIPGGGVNASTAIKADWKDRVNWGLSMNFGRLDEGDFRYFIKYDHGYDYYNINFWRKIRRLQVGITADPFRI
ncbi:MAG: hypothetical protein E2O77_13275 [Caldithrix sp.]|nr:MAG: hypothetical protein E2O77_13275 [Caldithrix sp.]